MTLATLLPFPVSLAVKRGNRQLWGWGSKHRPGASCCLQGRVQFLPCRPQSSARVTLEALRSPPLTPHCVEWKALPKASLSVFCGPLSLSLLKTLSPAPCHMDAVT